MNRRLRLAALLLALGPQLLAAEPRPPLDAAGMRVALDKLGVVGGALYIAAHPDDENTACLSWLARGRGVRTSYLSITRGDGGQNLIGSEKGTLLGVLRTDELLAARAVDGAEQWFTRAVDFGYSKSSQEALAIWDHDAILADLVWRIRKLRPDILITRFPTDNPDTHGHHTASAILAREAFAAAGDAARFPEQLDRVQPFRPRRLWFNNWRPKLEGRPPDAPALVTVDLGAYEPRLGQSWSEIAARSRSMHKSQGFGAAAKRGPLPSYFELVAGEPVPAGSQDLFAGIDLGWSRVPGGGALAARVAELERSFDAEQPEGLLPGLYALLGAIDALPAGPDLASKRDEVLALIRSAAGLWLEAIADAFSVTPGASVAVTTTALQRRGPALRLEAVVIEGRTGEPPAAATLAANEPLTRKQQIQIDASEPPSEPFWLRTEHAAGTYRVDDPELRGRPDNPPVRSARFRFAAEGGVSFEIEEPVVYRWTDPVKGELYRPLEVVPRATLALDDPVLVFASPAPKKLRVRVTAAVEKIEGKLGLDLPPGYRAEPAEVAIRLTHIGEETAAWFTVTPPAAAPAEGASGRLRARLETEAGVLDRALVRIDYPHVPIRTLFPEAEVSVVRVDLGAPRGRIGYLMGAGDEVPEALRQAGYEVTLLDDAALDDADLSGYQAIVAGVRAYNTRDRLKAAQRRLLAWVEQGGTLVVQYATTAGLLFPQLGPFPFTITHERVTDERAPVRFVLPEHPLLNRPNKLGLPDFEGWVQERGLYFANPWDPRYQTPIASHDPGEPERLGSLLHARHGKGTFIYTGIAFFRQLPAGVPGAYRLFANLLAAGDNDGQAPR